MKWLTVLPLKITFFLSRGTCSTIHVPRGGRIFSIKKKTGLITTMMSKAARSNGLVWKRECEHGGRYENTFGELVTQGRTEKETAVWGGGVIFGEPAGNG